MAPLLLRHASALLGTWPGRLLATAATLASVGIGLLVAFQERLIYLPRIPGVPDAFPFYPDRFGLEYEDVWLTAGDGVKLHAWLLKPPGASSAASAPAPPLPVVLFFQENAGNMAMRLPFLRALIRALGCAVLAPSYRGYGLSEGAPSEAGLRLDAQAAVDHAFSRADLDPARVALFGRSLGGAVALATAAANRERGLAGVVVENTFLSIEAVAPALLPVLRPFLGPGKPLGRLLRSKWRNDVEAAALRVGGGGGAGGTPAGTTPPPPPPVLLLSSLKDEMLPPAHMRQLWFALGGGEEGSGGACVGGVPLRQDVPAAGGAGGSTPGNGDGGRTPPSSAAAPRVRWVAFEEGGHLDAYDACAAQYWPAVVEFARVCGFAAVA